MNKKAKAVVTSSEADYKKAAEKLCCKSLAEGLKRRRC